MAIEMANPTNPLLEAALLYARRGWPIIALHTPTKNGCSCGKKDCDSIGKHPRYHEEDLSHGAHSATTDEKTIKTWWQRWPTANVGLATGQHSFDVLDVDIDDHVDGNETLRDLEAQYGKLPETPEQITGGGGRQILFKPTGGLKNAVRFAPGLDTRTDGGLIVAPPSCHVSGRRYEWELSSHPDEIPLAQCPSWLLKKVKEDAGVGDNGNGPPNPSGWQDEALQGVGKGQRNATCAKLAGRYVGFGMSDNEIVNNLLPWNQKNTPPLPDDEVIKIIQSVRATHNRKHPESEAKQTTKSPEDALIRQVAFRLSDRINLNKQEEKIGEKTGFKFLDRAIYGLVKTFLYIIGAYTSVGKTALLTQLVINTLEHNPAIRIAVFSTEMASEHILLRLMANRTTIPSLAIFRGHLDNDRQKLVDGAFDYFYKKNIWIFDDVYTFTGIQAKCKEIGNLDVVFVDFLQNMQGEGGIYERMSVLPVQLQRMAKDLNTCVVAMSQVSNEAARGDPRIIGFKGAGEIAAACDLGLWLERDKDDDQTLLCYIRKNRHGPIGKATLKYTNQFTRIEEVG